MIKRFFLLMIISIVLSGCASMSNSFSTLDRYVTEIDSYGNDSNLILKKYILFPDTDAGIKKNDLQYIEFANYVKKILKSNGYTEAISDDSANVIIYIKYGISDPSSYQVTRSVPHYGQTGVSSINTTSRTTGSSYGSASGSVTTYGSTTYGSASRNSSGSSTTNTTTRVTPTYGITGYSQQSHIQTEYTRHLSLTAYDLNYYKLNNEELMIWNTNITSTGSSGDLRKIFPILIIAGSPYIGKSTGNKITKTIYSNDVRINQLKGIN